MSPLFFRISKSLLKPVLKNSQNTILRQWWWVHYLKIISITSWHNSLYHCSTHPATKWCLWTSSPSPSWNGPYPSSWCKSWFLLLAVCFSNSILLHKQTTHASPPPKITLWNSLWTNTKLFEIKKIWVCLLPSHTGL